MAVVVDAYRLTRQFPKTEVYGLASQIQRSAAAVPANIAEGHGRDHIGDYLHHLSIAKGSLMELETHVIVAHKLAYISEEQLHKFLFKTSEVGKMLEGLARSLRHSRTGT